MKTFKYVLGFIGAVIVMMPAFAMAGLIASSKLHFHPSLLHRIMACVLLTLVGWLIVRKFGWKNLLGWTLSLIIGLSALTILAFLVGGFNPLLGLIAIAIVAVAGSVIKGGSRYV